jgi:hypothetical protein
MAAHSPYWSGHRDSAHILVLELKVQQMKRLDTKTDSSLVDEEASFRITIMSKRKKCRS